MHCPPFGLILTYNIEGVEYPFHDGLEWDNSEEIPKGNNDSLVMAQSGFAP